MDSSSQPAALQRPPPLVDPPPQLHGGLVEVDAIVVGGGFFGCSIATALAARSKRVVVIEREAVLLGRASHINQARVHGGYHYPRSVLTGFRSQANLPQFTRDYADCVSDELTHYYAVASKDSKVTVKQFEAFCQRIGAPLSPAPAAARKLFDSALIEAVYTVHEPVFDAVKLRARMIDRLANANVEVRLNTSAVRISKRADGRLSLTIRDVVSGEESALITSKLFNATYASLNELLRHSDVPPVPLRLELAELALVEPPPALASAGVTVMCGPYFSMLPFPSEGLHSLSHVRYTPHAAWEERDTAHALQASRHERATNYTSMVYDARRYLPAMNDCRYVKSLWELKAILPQSEQSDARPILFKAHDELPGLFSVMGGKIDNVYDLARELERAGLTQEVST